MTQYNTLQFNFARVLTLQIVDRVRVNVGSVDSLVSFSTQPDLVAILSGAEFQQECILTYPSYDLSIAVNENFSVAISDTSVVEFNTSKNTFIAKNTGTVQVDLGYKGKSASFIIIVNEQPLSITPYTVYGTACAGSSFNIRLNKTGNFDPATTYSIELSDNQGSFLSPVILASGNNLQEYLVTIPQNTPIGQNYLIRVRADIDNYTSTDNLKISIYDNTVAESFKSGYWVDPSTWNCGTIPTVMDDVRIKQSHVITLPIDSNATAKSIELQGSLQYDPNAKIQLGQ